MIEIIEPSSRWLPPVPEHPKILLKFGERRYMEEFRSKGRMRFGTFQYYRAYEDRVRGDRAEGVDYYLQPHLISVTFGGVPLASADITAPVTTRPNSWNQMNLYCMYLLHPGSFPIHPRNKEFGDAAVLFTHGEEFIRRFRKKLDEEGFKYSGRHVEYVPGSHHGKLGPFRKLDDYAYQSEWRMVLNPGTGQTLFLDIGSLEDISDLVDIGYLNSKVEIREEEAAG